MLATFQVLKSHMWLVATILDSAGIIYNASIVIESFIEQ